MADSLNRFSSFFPFQQLLAIIDYTAGIAVVSKVRLGIFESFIESVSDFE